MISLEVLLDIERSKKAFRTYYVLELRRRLKKTPFLVLYGTSVFFTAIGFITGISIWANFGFAMFMLVSLWLLYILLRYWLSFVIFIKTLKKSIDRTSSNLTFSFDEEGITREAGNYKDGIKWAALKSYEQNGDDFYLFIEGDGLYDIISMEILGEEYFNKFGELLKSNVSKRP